MKIIKVGFLISYDYEYIMISLPRVYEFVNEIYFAVDINRKTWSGNDFNIPEEFWKWVASFDRENKINIYEDNFFVPELSIIDCDTRERNMLSQYMGKCDWYIQIDSDEYFLDFGAFINKLRVLETALPVTVRCTVATLFKQLDSGFLVVNKSHETLCFATNYPKYDMARDNTSGNQTLIWDDLVLHQSWARKPEDLRMKLNSWSHKTDFNTDSYYALWLAADEDNCYCFHNFHPVVPETWPELIAIRGSINEILEGGQLRQFVRLKIYKRKNYFSRTWKKLRKIVSGVK